jgi:hypothetical protein
MIARFDGFEQLAGAYLFGLPPLSQPWPGERSSTGHTAQDSPGGLGGSGAPHPGQQSGSGRPGPGGPRTGTHDQRHQRPDRSRRAEGPY